MLASLRLVALLASVAATVHAQTYPTEIIGTWSSGSGAVLTGPAIVKPYENSFKYPVTAGWSFSFTDDGYFEQSQFTWNSNAIDHNCVEAVLIWQHGTYEVHNNGSITTDSTIFAGDGRIQTQSTCTSETTTLNFYNEPGLYKTWATSFWRGSDMLRLGDYSGALMPRLYKKSSNPRDFMHESLYLSNHTDPDLTR